MIVERRDRRGRIRVRIVRRNWSKSMGHSIKKHADKMRDVTCHESENSNAIPNARVEVNSTNTGNFRGFRKWYNSRESYSTRILNSHQVGGHGNASAYQLGKYSFLLLRCGKAYPCARRIG